MNLFNIRGTYSFDVWPAAILGNEFKNVVVLSLMDPESARQFADIHALHAQIFPYLPTGTPNDPTAYDYIKIKTVSGAITVLGLPWINEQTIVNVESVTIDVTISNVTSQDLTRVRDALTQNGYQHFTIRVR